MRGGGGGACRVWARVAGSVPAGTRRTICCPRRSINVSAGSTTAWERDGACEPHSADLWVDEGGPYTYARPIRRSYSYPCPIPRPYPYPPSTPRPYPYPCPIPRPYP